MIRAGSPGFRQLAKKTNERFQMGEDEHISRTFFGFSLARTKDRSLEQNKHFYMHKLERLHLEASFLEFRSMRMRLGWLANTRPDCQFEISQLAQVNENRYLAEKPVIFSAVSTDRHGIPQTTSSLSRLPLLIKNPFASSASPTLRLPTATTRRRSLAIFASLQMATVAPCRSASIPTSSNWLSALPWLGRSSPSEICSTSPPP